MLASGLEYFEDFENQDNDTSHKVKMQLLSAIGDSLRCFGGQQPYKVEILNHYEGRLRPRQ